MQAGREGQTEDPCSHMADIFIVFHEILRRDGENPLPAPRCQHWRGAGLQTEVPDRTTRWWLEGLFRPVVSLTTPVRWKSDSEPRIVLYQAAR